MSTEIGGMPSDALSMDLIRYPLPEGVSDEVLNKNQLARALNASEPTIDRWIADGMPVLQEGSNGRSYQFQLSHCFAWRRAREADRQQTDERAERAVQQMRLALIGGAIGDTERGLSPKERAAIYQAELTWNQMARERGELVPYAELVDLFDAVLGAVRAAVEGLPDRIKRDADLTPAQLRSVIQTGDDMLDDLSRQIDAWIQTKRAQAASAPAELVS